MQIQFIFYAYKHGRNWGEIFTTALFQIQVEKRCVCEQIKKLRRQYGTSANLFPSYLNEFMYGANYGGRDIIQQFLVDIKMQYVI